MLLAIDVGNSHTVIGLHDGADWVAVWRLPTRADMTEDQLAATYFGLCREAGIAGKPTSCMCASVVPSLNDVLRLFASKWLALDMPFLTADKFIGMRINYEPRTLVGADRLANAIAARAHYTLPCIVVDFGTATTFDAVAEDGGYEGGAIMPGVEVSMAALVQATAKLQTVELLPPLRAIGHDTPSSMQSGLVLGYAGAVDALVRRIRSELGGRATVVATGGLAQLFAPLCDEVQTVDAMLTLNGLFIAATEA